jgi:hypothetical protein
MVRMTRRSLKGLPWSRLISVMLLFALCLSALPQSGALASDAQASCKFKHKVEAGDTLAYLGQLYQVDWTKIADANDLKPPYLLIIDQVVCIPEGVKPDDTSTSTSTGSTANKPTMTVVPSFNSVVVAVVKFPKQAIYNVQVYKKSNYVLYKIGRLRTNKEGAATESYQLPSYVLSAKNMVLCLKNVRTDAQSCVEYTNTYSNLYSNFANCKKNGK